jgi:hypothetical protein
MNGEPPPAGWYPNPDGSANLRWWSGVGWTEYTREGTAPAVPDGQQEPTEVLAAAEPTQPAGWGQPEWSQPGPSVPPSPYLPAAPQPLTASGMRPLNGMFTDIGRIVRRAWLPILGLSIAIWAVVTVVYVAAVLAFVDLDALERGFNLLSAQTSPETGTDIVDAEVSAAFRDAFAALSPAGWALLGVALTVLLLLATTIQTAAVSRLGMDAAAGQPVSWAAGWKAGFTAGFRLFGYYLLLGVLTALAWTAAAILLVGLWALSPALSVFVGLLVLLALTVLSVWLLGRLIPVIVQVVLGGGAVRWSWTHTRGKFWAVLGRYLLWSIAASVIVNVIVTILSIPVSLLLLGTSANTSTSEIGASLVLTVVTLPLSMALTAVTLIGIVPIWRDLTDHPSYRAIDEQGQPITSG